MMYINDRWLIEPEVKAYIHKLEELNAEIRAEAERVLRENTVLREKQESADRQIAEYKRLLKSATNVLNMFIPCDEDYCSECIKQRQNCDYDDSFKWRYADEALALIGGEKNEDTND
jgi:hypothetical protein